MEKTTESQRIRVGELRTTGIGQGFYALVFNYNTPVGYLILCHRGQHSVRLGEFGELHRVNDLDEAIAWFEAKIPPDPEIEEIPDSPNELLELLKICRYS